MNITARLQSNSKIFNRPHWSVFLLVSCSTYSNDQNSHVTSSQINSHVTTSQHTSICSVTVLSQTVDEHGLSAVCFSLKIRQGIAGSMSCLLSVFSQHRAESKGNATFEIKWDWQKQVYAWHVVGLNKK